MNYLNISHCDQLNGEGNRVVLWVAGCGHRCKGCQNAHTWDPDGGIRFDEKAKEELFADLSADWCAGLTFSGGDPMFEGNRAEVIALAKEVKERFPDKTIWCYTGYEWGEMVSDESMSELFKYVDVLCDGKYVEELKDIDRHWVGSSNQNVIDVKRRIEQVSSLR